MLCRRLYTKFHWLITWLLYLYFVFCSELWYAIWWLENQPTICQCRCHWTNLSGPAWFHLEVMLVSIVVNWQISFRNSAQHPQVVRQVVLLTLRHYLPQRYVEHFVGFSFGLFLVFFSHHFSLCVCRFYYFFRTHTHSVRLMSTHIFFCVAVPSLWNSVADSLRNSTIRTQQFYASAAEILICTY